MDVRHQESADAIQSALERGEHDASRFRAALLEVPHVDRDAWFDRVASLDEIPDDGPALPKGCVPYLPCPVDALLRVVDHAPVRDDDIFVDVGSGVGRATTFVHLLTGVVAIGIEIQPNLVRTSREHARRLHLERVSYVEGDATKLAELVAFGSFFFLYCPFSGNHLSKALAGLASLARTRTLRIGCVDLPLPPCDWLTLENALGGDVTLYRSTSLEAAARTMTPRA